MIQIKYIIVMEHTAIMHDIYPSDINPKASIIRVEMVHGKVERVTHLPPLEEDYSSLEARVSAHLVEGLEMRRQLERKDTFKRYSGRILSDEERKRRDDFFRNIQ